MLYVVLLGVNSEDLGSKGSRTWAVEVIPKSIRDSAKIANLGKDPFLLRILLLNVFIIKEF
ncbi:hypothetical protein FH5T_14300 [Draconibacterium orientale]|uniref:Uncharacterized protein n=1 Tax=Draconibacterium orientale TaxID=1168034 RepID=A0ABM5QEI5_9BACT|nr:hypothetical protein FH5T_14300 [Draconibacterium orientale]